MNFHASKMYVVWSMTAVLLTFGLGACGDDGNSNNAQPPAENNDANNDGDCSAGTEGCRCLDNGTCRLSGLECVMGICEAPQEEPCDPSAEQCPPANPICYTPCRGDLIGEDGTRRRCSPDGLMEGCLSGAVCDRGSCVPTSSKSLDGAIFQQEGLPPGTCGVETDCPDFQTCIRGRCYSDCEADTDCDVDEAGNAQVCERKVCRSQCGEAQPCPNAQTACNEDGICLPLTQAGDEEIILDSSSFDLGFRYFLFSAERTEAVLLVENTGETDLTIDVVRTEQVTFGPDGSREAVALGDDGVNAQEIINWVEINGQTDPTVTVEVPIGQVAQVAISGVRRDGLERWEGALEMRAEGATSQRLRLVYSQSVAGRWVGNTYTFGTFDDGQRPGANPLEQWRQERTETAHLETIPNAFLQVWGRYRNGDLSQNEFAALLDATLTGSWNFDRVRQLCRQEGFDSNTICAPFGGTGSSAVIAYTTAADSNPVPSGLIEQDFALNLREGTGGECAGAPACLIGRIDSASALQYGANPQVVLTFDQSPGQCSRLDDDGACVTYLRGLDATMAVGGRAPFTGGNVQGFDVKTQPWLLPDFGHAVAPGETSTDDLKELRDTRLPFEVDNLNIDYAAANPIPDGRARLRHLELIDGMVFDQRFMTLLLRETVETFDGGPPLVSYLYVSMEKGNDPLELVSTQGNTFDDPTNIDGLGLSPTCSSALLETVLNNNAPVNSLGNDDLNKLAQAIIQGGRREASALPSNYTVHSLCVWEEDVVDNGGVDEVDEATTITRQVVNAGAQGNRPCFPGAEIIYFALPNTENPSAWSCNTAQAPQAETCLTELINLINNGTEELYVDARFKERYINDVEDERFALIFECEGVGRVSCDNNRYDLTEGKAFSLTNGVDNFFVPLETEIAQAFRYKTQFVSRTGTQLGFAPSICLDGSNLVPYCYEPSNIEALRDRVDCALDIQANALGNLEPGQRSNLQQFLERNFSALNADEGGELLSFGFERLYAELLIMLGDDAFTQAFASRFDLSASRQIAFEGSRFEEEGIDLSGAAGFEMVRLYQATQYFDLVLNRFYNLVPQLWQNLEGAEGDRFVTGATITSWLDRVIRASSQNANAWNEIAKRYQSFNRDDLARRVLERAYTRSHLESMILRTFMQRAITAVDAQEAPQVRRALEDAQRRYRVAMLDMRTAYQQASTDVDFFGLPPDQVPFPALDEDSVNGFEIMLERARDRLELAASDEERAIAVRREFDTDQASFQAELVTLRQSYEAQLGELCGTFLGADGRVYPAIARYSDKSPELQAFDDPCGAGPVASGSLWLAGADLQTFELELRRVRQEAQNILTSISDARKNVADQCDLIDGNGSDVEGLAERFLKDQQVIDDLEGDIDRLNGSITNLDKIHDIVTESTARANDFISGYFERSYTQDGLIIASNLAYLVSAGVNLGVTAGLQEAIIQNQKTQRDKERFYEEFAIKQECEFVKVEGGFIVRELQRELLLVELDILNALWNVQVQFSNIQALANERNRIETEWFDTEQLLLNVEAARNDPNVRIYKNDAILNADRSFESAIRQVWRATRTYEYYTASSYADRERLFLVRMVDNGDINLRRYVEDLEEAYLEFEQVFGNPDTRVATVSLKDDILKIPRYANDGSGVIYSSQDRVDLLRQALADPNRINDDGALAFRFSTTYDFLSPLTINHKILFIEVEFFGEALGDHVGRIYLRQKGSGVLEGTDGRQRFFTFDPRTAVMNPFFNGERAFGQDSDGAITGPTRSIYRSYRFRERPFIQTDWELVLDQRQEQVNQDINLSSIDDIVVYIYYTDFTRED